MAVTDGRLLDHEPCRCDTDFERGVIQVARRSPRSPRRSGLEHAAVDANEMATSAEGQPVQVDRGPLQTFRGGDGCACAGDRHVANDFSSG